jgi:hypothetical protein
LPHRSHTLTAFLWLPLAAWLALWPAMEARQAPRPLVSGAMVRKARPVTVGGCHARAAMAVARPQGDGCGSCCADRNGSERRMPACPEQGSARCGQCFGTNGLLLVAHVLSMPDPERPELGLIRHGDHVAASRDLRPPEPPPRAAHPFPFA